MNQNYDVQQIAVNEVSSSGESVVWSGQPDPLRLAMKSVPVFIFAIPWTAFSLFWIYGASGFQFPPDFSEGGFSFFPLFGLPFVLVGLAMFFSPIYQYINAFRTTYIITNKTVRVLRSGRTKKVETYPGNDIQNIQRIERTDGSGDIIFKQDISYDNRGKTRMSPIGFYGIHNVRMVEQHLIGLRQSSSQHPGNEPK